MRLNLVNGWTLSCVPDMHGNRFSVAAWPTTDPENVPADDRRWFVFELGGVEKVICDLPEFVEIAVLVAKAERPA